MYARKEDLCKNNAQKDYGHLGEAVGGGHPIIFHIAIHYILLKSHSVHKDFQTTAASQIPEDIEMLLPINLKAQAVRMPIRTAKKM